jgi:hypothetical protein
MNAECKRIADQLTHTIIGGMRYEDSLREILKDVTASQARARPVPSAHPIWKLTLPFRFMGQAGSAGIPGRGLRSSFRAEPTFSVDCSRARPIMRSITRVRLRCSRGSDPIFNVR